MGAPTGLFVEGFDGDDAHLAVDDGRCNFEGSQQVGPAAEFGFREIAGVERMGAGENGVYFGFEFGAEGRGEAFPFEVDAGVVDVDLRAGDPGVVIAEGERVQDVKHGVIAGEGETAGAADGKLDGLADGEFRVGGKMPEDVIGVRVDGGNGESRTAWQRKGTVVARLAATAGIETGLVEGYRVRTDRDYGSLRGQAMIVVPVETAGGRNHRKLMIFWPSWCAFLRSTPCGASS